MTQPLNQITEALRQQIDQLPPGLQAAAKYILDHPADFGLDPIRETAAKIGVSSNVLVRLAHRIGFDGFEAFRAPFRTALVTDSEDHMSQSWLSYMQDGDAFSAAQAQFAQNAQNVVMRSLRLMHPDKVRKAVEIMTQSDRCFVTATRASYALSYYFSYTGRMAHPGLRLVPRHMGAATDDLLDATPTDCLIAITVSPYSSDTIQSMRLARRKSMPIILIADSEVVAPGIEPDVVFPVSPRSLHHFSSYAGAMVVLECLLGHLFQAGGDAARERVDAYQKSREDTGAYWRPSQPPRIRRT
ncbi:MurR/RpiR family transcriptional regulator [Ruegeria arenilitoris]|uniref:MurR/RpiR family transcriptional regulator n=1 Tax=Ruegeria arenilitoris TaxID=1173585 RepID=UPI001481AE3F|nr:MurR/RpiR family transcriptional regulator [Ruegeria arenilitoris]